MSYVLEVKKLNKSYGNVTAVKDLSIAMKKGEIFGLLGANGSGKSTTIECILGTKQPDSGTIRVLGMNPKTDRKKLFEEVGVQFQESNYQEKIKVWELCELTASLYKNPAEYTSLLKQFGLEEKKKCMISELSGGQKQRLFIILALIPNPKLVFLDELTTGLDTRARREVWKCLEQMKEKGLTVFLTSHYMDEVENLCNRILILKKEAIIFEGTVEGAIKESPYDNLEEAYLWFTDEKA